MFCRVNNELIKIQKYLYKWPPCHFLDSSSEDTIVFPEITWRFWFHSFVFCPINQNCMRGAVIYFFCKRNNNNRFISSDNCFKFLRLHLELLTKTLQSDCFLCHFHAIYSSVTYAESARFYWQYAYFILKYEQQNQFDQCHSTRSMYKMYL